MTADQILVLVASGGLIGLVYWFFLGKKETTGEVSTSVKITVSGGYSPDVVYVPVGQPVRLSLLRTDPNSCLEEFIVPDLKIKKDLPVNQSVILTLTVVKPGEYPFHCGMNMYHGKIVAK